MRHFGLFSWKHFFALILIAFTALFTSASAQIVYKCGESYGQTPCPGGSALNVEDSRSLAQKQQTEETTRRDAKQAQTLEKDRLAQEKAALKHTPAAVKTQPKAATNAVPSDQVVHKVTPKLSKGKNKKPEAFIAQVPGSEKKPVKKKSKSKKAALPA